MSRAALGVSPARPPSCRARGGAGVLPPPQEAGRRQNLSPAAAAELGSGHPGHGVLTVCCSQQGAEREATGACAHGSFCREGGAPAPPTQSPPRTAVTDGPEPGHLHVDQPVRPVRVDQVTGRHGGNAQFPQERCVRVQRSLHHDVLVGDQVQDHLGEEKASASPHAAPPTGAGCMRTLRAAPLGTNSRPSPVTRTRVTQPNATACAPRAEPPLPPQPRRRPGDARADPDQSADSPSSANGARHTGPRASWCTPGATAPAFGFPWCAWPCTTRHVLCVGGHGSPGQQRGPAQPPGGPAGSGLAVPSHRTCPWPVCTGRRCSDRVTAVEGPQEWHSGARMHEKVTCKPHAKPPA